MKSAKGDVAIARKYATALYAQASSVGKQKECWQALCALVGVCGNNSVWESVYRSPAFDSAARTQAVEIVLNALSYDNLTFLKNFMFLLMDNGRMLLLPQISEQYRQVYFDSCNMITVNIQTAINLNADETAQIEKSITESLPGLVPVFEYVLKPDILGGIVVYIGSICADMSLKTKLNNLLLVMRGI